MPNITSPEIESPRGFLLAAYNSIVHNAKAHRKTRILLISYLLAFVIAPPIFIMTAFFAFPLHTARFFNFPLKSNAQVLGENTDVKQGNVLGEYVSAVFEPQAVGAVRVLRVVAPEVGSAIILPAEASGVGLIFEKATGEQSVDEYQIANIDEDDIGYYGYNNKDGGWYIIKIDTDGSFRYSRGNTDFPANWERRDKLEYDYFNNVFN